MRYLFFILLISVLTCCKQEKNTASSFEFYPDTTITSVDSFYKQKINILTSIYNLQDLTKGTSDSLIIRFWPWYAFEPFSNMFEFRLDSFGWKGYHYCSYTFMTNDGFVYLKGHENLGDDVFVVKKITPRCGWKNLYDSILLFQLKTLPTQSLIKKFEFKGILDGYALEFEIATKNSYRWIHYSNPNSYPYKECHLIDELEGMFIRQFGDDYYWPTSSK